MSNFIPPWLIAVLALAWGACGFYAGHRYSDNAWQARQAKQVQAQALALQDEQVRSQAAARQAIDAQLALKKSYTVLKEKFDAFTSRGPLVVWRNGASAVCDTGAVPGGVPGGAVAPGQPPGHGPAGSSSPDAGAYISLSAGAVWMWNSALIGADAPVGACGVADPASPACALDAGLGLEAAWANHAANTQTCAADRLRHQRLIDYINAAQGTTP
jgi:hypothetical protein